MGSDWTPESWKQFEKRQMPDYDEDALRSVTDQLHNESGLVGFLDIARLREELETVEAGEGFLVQGGDCAETFAEFHPHKVRDLVYTLLTIGECITGISTLPVTHVGRIGGQFAKPRSAAEETQHGDTLPVYRGDIVNAHEFHPDARVVDPTRISRAYAQNRVTLAMMEALEVKTKTKVFTSHEALLLPYEQALISHTPCGIDYSTSAHMLWIGERTRFEGSSHVEFCRGLYNPIGVKVGPVMAEDPYSLERLLDTCNPLHENGKMVVISRMGSAKIKDALPKLVEVVKAAGHPVVWSCDPMHGNTVSVGQFKTRPMACVLSEVNAFFEVCQDHGIHPGALHLEMTGQPVTECIGVGVPEEHLSLRNYSHCDPRLNAEQAEEVVQLAATMLSISRSLRPTAVV